MRGGVLTELLGIALGITLLSVFAFIIRSVIEFGFFDYIQLAIDKITILFGTNFTILIAVGLVLAILISLARWIMSFVSFSGQKPNT